MGATQTNLTSKDLPDNLHKLRMDIEQLIPVGKLPHPDTSHLNAKDKAFWDDFETLHPNVHGDKFASMKQCGTLGGGNHFIELCLDEKDRVWMVLHSGSRNIGKEVAESYIDAAQLLEHNKQLPDPQLSVFLAGSPEFKAYTHDLFWCQEYAFKNRAVMFELYKDAMFKHFPQVRYNEPILCHHNYVATEYHFGEQVYVTRKGAINAEKGRMGIVPGSMGAKTFIVEGKGCEESYNSAPHGAGRKMSRSKARKNFTVADLVAQTKGIECKKDASVLDEIPGCYKDIVKVMQYAGELVTVKHELRQVLNIKG